MPGHNLGKGIPFEFLENIFLLESTEIPGMDNLHLPKEIIKEAMELAAKTFGAEHSFLLVNGSTCGVHSMIMSTCKRGDRLIVSRDCHKSILNGMMMAGVDPIYIKPCFDNDFGIPTVVLSEQIKSLLKQYPDVVGVLITRPNYYGMCCDIQKIADIVHANDKILLVDEAHGSHLKFNDALPICAMDAGADICVQSAHKTLTAFTQGAFLHVKGNKINLDRLRANLSMLQTSSPSYVLMTFLDIAREMMDKNGKLLLDTLLKNIEWFENFINKNQKKWILLNSSCIDKTRIVLNTRNIGKTGFDIELILREKYNLQIEMADVYNIVCVSTISNCLDDFKKLGFALIDIAERSNDIPHDFKYLADVGIGEFEIPVQKINLGEVMQLESKKCKLDKSVNMISKGMLIPYPPGIPIICPGEVIQESAVEHVCKILNAGGVVHGINDELEIDVIKDTI